MQSDVDRFYLAQPQSPAIFLLLSKGADLGKRFTVETLRERLADPSLSIVLPDDVDGKSLIITWRGKPYAVFEVPSAIPAEEFASALRSPAASGAMRKAVRSHRAHLIIAPMFSPADMVAAITQSVYLMQISKALGESLGTSLAYFWVHSKQVRLTDEFNELAQHAHETLPHIGQSERQVGQGLPLSLWVGINLFSDEDQTAGLTQGLSAYAGHELELSFLSWPESDVYLRLANLVAFLFAQGPVLAPGHTVELAPEETFTISSPQTNGDSAPTLVLILDQKAQSEDPQ